MKMNNVSRKIPIICLVIALLSVSYGTYFCVSAHSTEASDNYATYTNVIGAMNNIIAQEINQKERTLLYLKTIRDNIVGELGDNTSDMRTNLREAIGAGVDLSIGGAVAALYNQIDYMMTSAALLQAFTMPTIV